MERKEKKNLINDEVLNIIKCVRFVLEGVSNNDVDMARSYYEQLNDLMLKWFEKHDNA